ncbi:hypothetical protein HC766_05865 [Candidatus Gracilibacteria bacterium]|nr:hypothetical protein [Candidatus Gracilibacteria bacterium]
MMLLIVTTVIPASAQYGANNNLGTVAIDYPNEPLSSSTTINGLAGDVVDVPDIAGITDIKITLLNNASGIFSTFVVGPSDLPGIIPAGLPLGMYNFQYTDGLSSEDVEVSVDFKSPTDRTDDYDSINGYIFNSPAEAIPVTTLATNGADSLYQVRFAGSSSLVFLGSNDLDSGLIRTGGKIANSILPYIILAILGYALIGFFTSHKTSKANLYTK